MDCAAVSRTLAQAPPQQQSAATATADTELNAASAMIGRALFLRCLCENDNLTYDAAGTLTGTVKRADWTVSGMDVAKVSRKNSAIVLEGVRVAVRFNADRREFDRKPQPNEPIHVTIATTSDAHTFDNALQLIFAQGIDRKLQAATPPYWQHYFDPLLKWPDDLSSASILSIPAATADTTPAAMTHRADTGYTIWAARDHVAGNVVLHLVVDAEGNPRRIGINTPLGYGLDEKAAEAAEKYRFNPARSQGKA
ncbi:MAG: energy transducer TonB, partial [Bryocella sp.]